MTRTKYLAPLVGLALVAGVGLSSQPASAAATDPVKSVSPLASGKVGHPTEAQLAAPSNGTGEVVGSRKATQADVDSGFASTLAATIWICAGSNALYAPSSSITNPQIDPYLGGKLGWEESLTAAGRPEARVSTNNAVFAFNNHNPGTIAVYFSEASWANGGNSNQYLTTKWATRLSFQNKFTGGGQVGIKVLSTGHSDQSTGVWRDTVFLGSGWRNYISYWPSGPLDDSWPVAEFALTNSNFTQTSYSELYVKAKGTSCGTLERFAGFIQSGSP